MALKVWQSSITLLIPSSQMYFQTSWEVAKELFLWTMGLCFASLDASAWMQQRQAALRLHDHLCRPRLPTQNNLAAATAQQQAASRVTSLPVQTSNYPSNHLTNNPSIIQPTTHLPFHPSILL